MAKMHKATVHIRIREVAEGLVALFPWAANILPVDSRVAEEPIDGFSEASRHFLFLASPFLRGRLILARELFTRFRLYDGNSRRVFKKVFT